MHIICWNYSFKCTLNIFRKKKNPSKNPRSWWIVPKSETEPHRLVGPASNLKMGKSPRQGPDWSLWRGFRWLFHVPFGSDLSTSRQTHLRNLNTFKDHYLLLPIPTQFRKPHTSWRSLFGAHFINGKDFFNPLRWKQRILPRICHQPEFFDSSQKRERETRE